MNILLACLKISIGLELLAVLYFKFIKQNTQAGIWHMVVCIALIVVTNTILLTI